MRKKLLLFLLCAAALAIVCAAQGDDAQTAYWDAEAFRDGFLAVGTEGRIDRIDRAGTTHTVAAHGSINLRDVAADGEQALAVGDRGTAVLIQADGTSRKLNVGTRKDLRSVCRWNDQWFIGMANGAVCRGGAPGSWTVMGTPAKGTVAGLASDGARCIGVTSAGEVLSSTDGVSWNVLDYNKYYTKEVSFQGIKYINNMFWAFGTLADGRSMVTLSQQGGVWSERDLSVYSADSTFNAAQIGLTGITGDGQQAVAAARTGQALVLPGCPTCNILRDVGTKPLFAAAENNGMLLFAGEDYFTAVLPSNAVRQENIQAAAARELQRGGAILVDVRTEAEYREGHIPGSIRIEAAAVLDQLPKYAADKSQTLIFYCATGKRSQTALETAQQMGYANIYNLGGISNWPYGLEH